MIDANYIIKKLDLEEHTHEGGYFRESYRSKNLVLYEDELPINQDQDLIKKQISSQNVRPASTLIYYMLVGHQYSAIHRVKNDEIWHFYTGSSVTIHILNDTESTLSIQLGQNFDNNEYLHYVIEKDTWFGAEVNDKTSFALMGCTVSPGFDFEDFELGSKDDLIRQYPQHKLIIEKLSK